MGSKRETANSSLFLFLSGGKPAPIPSTPSPSSQLPLVSRCRETAVQLALCPSQSAHNKTSSERLSGPTLTRAIQCQASCPINQHPSFNAQSLNPALRFRCQVGGTTTWFNGALVQLPPYDSQPRGPHKSWPILLLGEERGLGGLVFLRAESHRTKDP